LETKCTHTLLKWIEVEQQFVSKRINRRLGTLSFFTTPLNLTEYCPKEEYPKMSTVPAKQNSKPRHTPLKIYQSLMREHFRKLARAGAKNSVGHHKHELAKCYLIQISALVMLLEQMPQAPEEFALDILAWTPEPRVERQIEAGSGKNNDHNGMFASVIEDLQATSVRLVENLRRAMESGELGTLFKLCEEKAPILRKRVAEIEDRMMPNSMVIY